MTTLLNDDFVLTVNHLNSRMERIEKEIRDLHDFKSAVFYIYQQKQIDTSIDRLQNEYDVLLSILKYMTNLKGVQRT